MTLLPIGGAPVRCAAGDPSPETRRDPGRARGRASAWPTRMPPAFARTPAPAGQTGEGRRHPDPRHAGAPHRGLEAESASTSYPASPRNWTRRWPARRSPPSCSTLIRRVASRAACSIWPTASRAAAKSKPVWAVANDMAFSAAYALASAAACSSPHRRCRLDWRHRHARRSVGEGRRDGVRYTAVFAGERKNDLNPHEPISDAAHAVLKAEVDRVYDLFVGRSRAIAESSMAARHRSPGLFFGPDAVATGLADAVGSSTTRSRATHAIAFPTPEGGSSGGSGQPSGLFATTRWSHFSMNESNRPRCS